MSIGYTSILYIICKFVRYKGIGQNAKETDGRTIWIIVTAAVLKIHQKLFSFPIEIVPTRRRRECMRRCSSRGLINEFNISGRKKKHFLKDYLGFSTVCSLFSIFCPNTNTKFSSFDRIYWTLLPSVKYYNCTRFLVKISINGSWLKLSMQIPEMVMY